MTVSCGLSQRRLATKLSAIYSALQFGLSHPTDGQAATIMPLPMLLVAEVRGSLVWYKRRAH